MLTWRWFWIATCEWISSVPFWTTTRWGVIDDITMGIGTARSWTRIFAFFSNTCKRTLTFSIDETFWSAIRRGAGVFWSTGTRWCSANVTALRIWATWWRNARIDINWIRWGWWWGCNWNYEGLGFPGEEVSIKIYFWSAVQNAKWWLMMDKDLDIVPHKIITDEF